MVRENSELLLDHLKNFHNVSKNLLERTSDELKEIKNPSLQEDPRNKVSLLLTQPTCACDVQFDIKIVFSEQILMIIINHIKPENIPVKTHNIIENVILLTDEDDLSEKCAKKVKKTKKRRIKSKYLKQF